MKQQQTSRKRSRTSKQQLPPQVENAERFEVETGPDTYQEILRKEAARNRPQRNKPRFLGAQSFELAI